MVFFSFPHFLIGLVMTSFVLFVRNQVSFGLITRPQLMILSELKDLDLVCPFQPTLQTNGFVVNVDYKIFLWLEKKF